jgi:hypothetical protein
MGVESVGTGAFLWILLAGWQRFVSSSLAGYFTDISSIGLTEGIFR